MDPSITLIRRRAHPHNWNQFSKKKGQKTEIVRACLSGCASGRLVCLCVCGGEFVLVDFCGLVCLYVFVCVGCWGNSVNVFVCVFFACCWWICVGVFVSVCRVC